ncbi:hypothetical protein A3A79_00085 [Candidatus Gottesmanbacteria bacterium RIFCSPLOWO2_01_FULL_43_11b]|uniref:Uncharacterized protein n=1 Tax=Candidatus Gottesmanbacteria bacterium RIFCSPLOWO2_01_FULL_43_11b TaxID=1798392 RepID=A0A1F6AFS7_9BACT|nr:MAG: hypothetical protein A3A79_00085 [Candidatus Gottesmanbacteria bacterium RIFCSPLOWO2_01_FULL_43_11b]
MQEKVETRPKSSIVQRILRVVFLPIDRLMAYTDPGMGPREGKMREPSMKQEETKNGLGTTGMGFFAPKEKG